MKFQEDLVAKQSAPYAWELLSSLVGWERRLGKGGTEAAVEDEFATAVMRALAFIPFDHEVLAPENWVQLRPEVHIKTEISPRGLLTIDLFPADGRASSQASSPPLGMQFRKSLPRTGLRLLDLDLRQLLDDDAPSSRTEVPVDWALKNSLDIDMERGSAISAIALQRSIIMKLYEHFVRSLATHFECKLLSGLVCYGPQRELAIRHLGLANEVEYANQIGYDGSGWHPRLAEMCAYFQLKPSEAIRLHQESSKGRSASEANAVFRSLAGMPMKAPDRYYSRRDAKKIRERDGQIDDLVAVLNAVADPGQIPPLVDTYREAVETFVSKLAEEHPDLQGLVSALAEIYALSQEEIRSRIAQLTPGIYKAQARHPIELIEELDRLNDAQSIDSSLSRHFEDELIAAATAHWERQEGDSKERLIALAGSLGFRGRPSMGRWASVCAPEFSQWIDARDPPRRPRGK